MQRIIITGSSGMLGHHLREEFPQAYCPSKNDMDLMNYKSTDNTISSYKPDLIIHAAAKVGGIMDNTTCPCDFFEENILINTNIIRSARLNGVQRLLAISSSCIFPDTVDSYPMTEEQIHIGPPAGSNFYYAYAKRGMCLQIDSCNKQYGTKYNYVIPCNLYSEYDKIDSLNKMHLITSILYKIIIAEINKEYSISLFGSGNPLRQFMYAGDLARIVRLLVNKDNIENLIVAPPDCNLSIKEIASKILNILSIDNRVSITYDASKPDGQFRKDVSNNKLQKILNFQFTSLEENIKKIYNTYAKKLYSKIKDQID